jgi:hypothetical protein
MESVTLNQIIYQGWPNKPALGTTLQEATFGGAMKVPDMNYICYICDNN